MTASADILRAHLNEVPQPLKAAITEEFSSGAVMKALVEIRAKHELTDDQATAMENECLIVLCNVTPFEELKDSLIAESGVTYETAVRIQRAFEADVILPIMKKAEARGYRPEDQPDRSGGGASEAPQGSEPSSHQEVLYQDRYVTVTPSLFNTVDGTVAISSIVEAKRGHIGPDRAGPLIILAVGFGVLVFLTGIGSKLLGFMISAAGGYWLYRVKPTYIIWYTLSSGEERQFTSTDKRRVDGIAAALYRVMGR